LGTQFAEFLLKDGNSIPKRRLNGGVAMSITIGDKVNVEVNSKLEEGFIIGIRPFRGQPKDYTTVWIEFSNFAAESKPNIQVVVRKQDIEDWSTAELEDWIAKSNVSQSKFNVRSA
jgi:hypothetical protein